MTDIKQNWVACDRFTRKVGSQTSKTGCSSHNLNLPDQVFNMICDPDNTGVGKEIGIVVLKSQKTGEHIISLIGIDDYQNLISILNKEVN